MNDTRNRSKTLEIFEALIEMGFQGHSIDAISRHTGLSNSAIRRCMVPLKSYGWVLETPMSATNKRLWKVSEKMVKIAFSYKRDCLNQVNTIQNNYLGASGEVLKDD